MLYIYIYFNFNIHYVIIILDISFAIFWGVTLSVVAQHGQGTCFQAWFLIGDAQWGNLSKTWKNWWLLGGDSRGNHSSSFQFAPELASILHVDKWLSFRNLPWEIKMEPKITQLKRKIIFQTFIIVFQPLIFRGVSVFSALFWMNWLLTWWRNQPKSTRCFCLFASRSKSECFWGIRDVGESTLLETNILAPENGWLEDDRFLLQ